MALLTGIDPGNFSLKVIQGQMSGPLFKVTRAVEIPIEADGDAEVAILREIQASLPGERLKAGKNRLGLTGRDLMVRYTNVPPVPLWRLKMLMDFEIQDMSSSSGDPLAADYNLIAKDEAGDDEIVLVGLVKSHFLESRIHALKGANLGFDAATPNCIALFNSYLAFGERSDEGYTLLLDIGDRNLEMAIEKDGDLVFARHLSDGGDLFTTAIAESWNVSSDKARELKHEYGNVTPRGRASYSSSSEEKVANAIIGVAGQLAGMVQSTINFARAQSGHRDLAVGRVLVSGGGSNLRGLDEYLAQQLSCKVEIFAPEGGLDLSALPADELENFEADPSAFVVPLGLARMNDDAEAFGLDLVPEKIKTQRRFSQRTLFMILSGVAAVLFLGFTWWNGSQQADAASSQYEKARRDESRMTRIRRGFEATCDEVTGVREKIARIASESRTAPYLLRAQAIVQQHAPESIWVRSLAAEIKEIAPPGSETDRKARVAKSIVVVRGRIRQLGSRVTPTFNKFIEDLRADARKPVVVITRRPAESGGDFEFSIDFEGWPEATANEDDDEEEDMEDGR